MPQNAAGCRIDPPVSDPSASGVIPAATATAEPEERYRLCATARSKTSVVEELVKRHHGDRVLVIGQYLDQLDDLGERLQAPVLKGETTIKERERLFEAFRSGELSTLVVSKVANFSIARARVAAPIQSSSARRTFSAACSACTSARPLALASGGKVRAT